jgi:hypothetical protein
MSIYDEYKHYVETSPLQYDDDEIDWNVKPEIDQIKYVRRNGLGIRNINNPSEVVQLAAISEESGAILFIAAPSEAAQLVAVIDNIWVFSGILNPTAVVTKLALTNQDLINDELSYGIAVKQACHGNALLIKKWLRYGNTHRNR